MDCDGRHASRLDVCWCDGPAIRIWNHDGTDHHYPLAPHEAAVIVRRLAGYLTALLRPEDTA